MSRRARIAAAAVLVTAIVVVLVGRYERAAERRRNLDGIALVRSLVGSRIGHPDNYRVSTDLYCLLYAARQRVFALELCSDGQGRLVEAVDRRGTLPKFYSVTSEPRVAKERIDLRLFSRLIAKLSAPTTKRAPRPRGTARRRARRSTSR